jgi:hypothetical protein
LIYVELARNGEQVEAFLLPLPLGLIVSGIMGWRMERMVCGEVEREEVGRFFGMSVHGLGQ